MFTQKNFKLTDEQYELINKWADNHKCSCKNRSCCGGEISITFTPTTIGTEISAKCICGETIIVDDL